jgi:iron complex transport system permease protein
MFMSFSSSSRRISRFRAIDTAYAGNALSMLVGAKALPASVIVDALTGTCQSADCTIIRDARLPRTLAGLLAGGALGLAGR